MSVGNKKMPIRISDFAQVDNQQAESIQKYIYTFVCYKQYQNNTTINKLRTTDRCVTILY